MSSPQKNKEDSGTLKLPSGYKELYKLKHELLNYSL